MNFTDHIGSPIKLPSPPQRIVSLVPSITELLFDLGLQEQILGRTKFCVYPEGGYTNAKIIGGTKNVHIDLVEKINPDLVIANKEENVKEQVEAISKFSPTFTTVVKTREDALKMITDLGLITNKEIQSKTLVEELQSNFEINQQKADLKVVYVIWKKPYMTVGGDTFISNFISDFGFINSFKDQDRYPSIQLEEIREKKPDLIMLSSEPYPFNEQDKDEIYKKTGIKTELVDGSYCSWYGSRMLKAQKYLRHLSNKMT